MWSTSSSVTYNYLTTISLLQPQGLFKTTLSLAVHVFKKPQIFALRWYEVLLPYIEKYNSVGVITENTHPVWGEDPDQTNYDSFLVKVCSES